MTLTSVSVVKVEFAGLGLFLTLGNMTPRFLVVDLWDVETLGVVGVVALVDGEVVAVGVTVPFEPNVVGALVVGVVSVERSSVRAMYLLKDKQICLVFFS